MADRLTQSELDKMNKSVSEMTDLSKNLRDQFSKIKNTTDVLSQNFKDIVKSAENNTNIAERYLIAQKTSSAVAERINEIKSKSSFLDSVGLEFKKEETKLQAAIAAAQIKALETQTSIANINNADREKAINDLKIQSVLRETELDYFEKNSNLQSNIIAQLENQKSISDGILNNITLVGEGENIRNKFLGFGKKILGDMGPLGSAVAESFNVSKINPWVLAAEVAVAILQKGYENFKAFDKAGVDVRKNLGALPGQATVLERNLKVVTLDMMHLGATFDDVAKSINEIANEFTGLVSQDRELLRTTTALSKQFGIAEGTSVKFLKTLGGISGSSASSQKSMIGFAQKMAQASGVPLGKIMEDVANASDDVRVYVGSSAVSMIKAATAARMMGIDMNKAAASAEKLLQFESSINAELKASALLGKNVNFNYARQLAFNKNIIGANQEILKIAKQVNFNQLNPIQQKAFADAAGKSVGELQDMLTQEKNIQLIRNGTNENAKKALANYERMMKLKDEEAKNEGKVAEQEILRKANQERMNQLQNKFNQMMSQLAEPIMDILSPLLDLGVVIIDLLGPVFKLVGLFIKLTSPIFLFVKLFKIMDRLTDGFFGKLVKAFSPLYWVLDIIKLILVPFQALSDFLDDLEDGNMSLGDAFKKMTDSMVTGFKEVGSQILKELTEPFMIAKEKISEWLGFSPSEIGLSMVKGLKSVGGMLLDAITQPFILGYNKIAKYVPGLSEMKLPNELTSDVIDDTNKKPDSVKSLNNDSLVDTIQSGNQQLIAKLDQLMNMMANGGIAVNLDGQRLNAGLSRASYRSGGFGQSTTLA